MSPMRVLRQIVAPTGRHRRAELAGPGREVLDEVRLEELLDAGEVVANEVAPCPGCGRSTFHAMHRDGSRRCWTCSTATVPGGEL